MGWIGSPSTAPFLQLLVGPLQQLARERPVRLLVVGGPAPAMAGVQVIERPWSLEQEVALIQQFVAAGFCAAVVGVMPLPDNPWTRGKCAYKLIQCMACGIPRAGLPRGRQRGGGAARMRRSGRLLQQVAGRVTAAGG